MGETLTRSAAANHPFDLAFTVSESGDPEIMRFLTQETEFRFGGTWKTWLRLAFHSFSASPYSGFTAHRITASELSPAKVYGHLTMIPPALSGFDQE
jgi:hypothetical protein